jgi:ribosomal-protein-alanine N-acetyltransferase
VSERSRIRPVQLRDAATLAELYARNREFLRPFEPDRPSEFFTVAGQQERIEEQLERAHAGVGRRFVILDDAGAVAGLISLEHIVRGPAESASVGYWVDASRNRQGFATAALGAVVEEAFGPLGLHRLDGAARVDNAASRRVLEKCGFRFIGIAPQYLRLGGAWRDHALYQRLAD